MWFVYGTYNARIKHDVIAIVASYNNLLAVVLHDILHAGIKYTCTVLHTHNYEYSGCAISITIIVTYVSL